MSDSLQPHGLQHARLPCSSLFPRVCSDSCPLSWWCHPTISSSVAPFSSYPQSFPASGSFPVMSSSNRVANWFSASASASVLPMNIQGWFPLGLTGLISLQSKGLSRVFSSTTTWKHQFSGTQPSLWSNSQLYITTGKTIAFTRQTFVSKVMFLGFKTRSSVICSEHRGANISLRSWFHFHRIYTLKWDCFFWGNYTLLFIMAVPFYVPTNSAQRLPFLCIFTNICYLLVFLVIAFLTGVS